MMQSQKGSIAVFDLDGTMIPHDSFGRLVKAHLFRRPSLIAAAVLRRLGGLDRAGFANRAQIVLQDILESAKDMDSLVDEIVGAIPEERLQLIENWKARGALTVLLSASPAAYVVPLGRKLGFDQAYGSGDLNGRFRHLHGMEKRRFIDETFPASQWQRAFAVADHPSDEPLLEVFEDVMRV